MKEFVDKAHKIKRRYFISTPGGEPYLERLVLEKDKRYLHTIYSSDGDRDPHDHPWDWSSLIIHGAYREHRFKVQCSQCRPLILRDGGGICPRCSGPLEIIGVGYKDFKQGDVNTHRAAELHRLELLTPVVVSVVDLGPRVREWGFQTSNGWVGHEEYLRVKDVEYE